MGQEVFGFIGVGKMGAPMSTRLLNAGHRVCVYDANEAVLAALEKARRRGSRLGGRSGQRRGHRIP